HLVAGGRGIGHRGGDLAAQDLCIELERLAALPLEAEAGHDLHTSPPCWLPPGPGRAGVLDSRPYDGWGGGGSTWCEGVMSSRLPPGIGPDHAAGAGGRTEWARGTGGG